MFYLYRRALLCALVLLCAYTEQHAQTFWQSLGDPPDMARTLIVTDNNDIYAGSFSGLARAVPTGSGWQQVTFPGSIVQSIVCDSHGALYAAADRRRLYRSTDNGATWTMVLDLGGGEYDSYNLAIDANDRIYAAAIKEEGIRYSDDGGTTWTELNAGLNDRYVNSFTIDDTGRLLACTEADGLYIFNSATSSWELFSVYQSGGMHNTILVATSLPNGVLFAASPSALYRSSDGGAHWSPLLIGTVTAMTTLPGGHLMIAGYEGEGSIVLLSSDGGQTWGDASGGVAHVTMVSKLVRSGTAIYLLSSGGVFKANLLSTSVELPGENAATRVYPNPSSGPATIAFSTKAAGHVRVDIYNAPGRLVATPISGDMPAGEHTAVLQTAAMEAGTYYYTITTGTSVSTGVFVVTGR